MEKVKLGIIGVGNMGSSHVRTIISGWAGGDATVAAIADLDDTKLARMKAIHPNAKTGALYSEPLIYQPWNYAKMADFTALHPSYNQLYRFQEQGIDFVKEAHDAGIAVNPWTANKEGIMRRLAIWGVDYIITDYPDVALRIIKELNEAEA